MKRTRPIGVLMAPGTNCHEETVQAIERAGHPARILLASDILTDKRLLMECPAIVLAGGFSWGDNFGSGRAAGLILGDLLRAFAATGRPMLGICNGFQIMMEAGLFDEDGHSAGALVPNADAPFDSRWVNLLALPGSPWTEAYAGQILRMPVAHGEGRWLMPEHRPRGLRPIFVFCDRNGLQTDRYPDNPNGSPGGVTGLAKDNVAAMMPHPERANDLALGSNNGNLVFQTLVRLARQ